MAYIPSSNSVVSFQGNPSVLQTLAGLMSTNASVITVGTAAPNQSVSGTVQTDVRGSVATVIIGGSIAASFTPPANQSVSGTVQTDVRGSIAAVIIGGSIAASFVPPANQSVSGTVTVNQGTNPWIQTGSVQGTMSVLGTVPVTQVTSPWIITGSVQASLTPAANQSVSGTVQVDVRGSVATVIIGGSIATTTGNSSVQVLNFPSNQSVSGAVSVSNFPTTQNVSGSVVATQGTNPWTVVSSLAGGIFPISGSVAAVVTNFPTTQNVSGSVVAFQAGTQITSLVSTIPSSVQVGASIFGQLPAGTAIIGSIAALQAGTVPWLMTFSNPSILAVPVGSVQVIWQAPSIVGTYLEDAPHTTADRGLFVMGVRNDTVASLTSASGDYSPIGVDNAGRIIIKPFSDGASSLIGTSSIVSTGNTASVVIFAAPGAGLRNYVTDFNFANTGAAATLVSINDADASVFAKTIAPAGGGSNFQYATPVTGPTANKATTVQIFTASSVVHFTIAGFKAP